MQSVAAEARAIVGEVVQATLLDPAVDADSEVMPALPAPQHAAHTASADALAETMGTDQSIAQPRMNAAEATMECAHNWLWNRTVDDLGALISSHQPGPSANVGGNLDEVDPLEMLWSAAHDSHVGEDVLRELELTVWALMETMEERVEMTQQIN